MADIELITDGIAKEIIKANDENLKKLLESNEKIKEDIVQTLMRSGEYAVRSFSTPYYFEERKKTDFTSSSKWVEIDWHFELEGRGIALACSMENKSDSIDVEDYLGIREIDGKPIQAKNVKDMWYPFEEKVELRRKGKYKVKADRFEGSIWSDFTVHLLLF